MSLLSSLAACKPNIHVTVIESEKNSAVNRYPSSIDPESSSSSETSNSSNSSSSETSSEASSASSSSSSSSSTQSAYIVLSADGGTGTTYSFITNNNPAGTYDINTFYVGSVAYVLADSDVITDLTCTDSQNPSVSIASHGGNNAFAITALAVTGSCEVSVSDLSGRSATLTITTSNEPAQSSSSSSESSSTSSAAHVPADHVTLTIEADAGSTFSFSISGGIKNINFGDGTTLANAADDYFEHIYADPGTFSVTFENNGCTDFGSTSGLITSATGFESLTSLSHLDLGYNKITSFDMVGLPSTLDNLSLYSNQLSTLNMAGIPNSVSTVSFSYNHLTSFDTSLVPSSLTDISLSNNNLTTIDISPIANTVTNLDLSGNNISSATINSILATLVTKGALTGVFYLDRMLPAAPPYQQGLTDYNTLVGNNVQIYVDQGVVESTGPLVAGSLIQIDKTATGIGANSTTFVALNEITVYDPSFSPDDSMVAFVSDATNLAQGINNQKVQVYVKNLNTGAITPVSVSSAGTQGDDNSYMPRWLSNTKLVFYSTATNLVSGDTNGAQDVFMHDLSDHTTTRISTLSDGSQISGDSFTPETSADGNFVVFTSNSTTLPGGDNAATWDIYLKNLQTGALTRVSTNSAGSPQNGYTLYPQIVQNGGDYLVGFWGNSPNMTAANYNDISVYFKNLTTGVAQFVSSRANGAGMHNSRSYNFSADGSSAVFMSSDGYLGGGGTWQCYLKNLSTGAIQNISTSSSGAAYNSDSINPVLSPDKSFAVFTSVESKLVDDNWHDYGSANIYMKNLSSGQVTLLGVDQYGTSTTGWNLHPVISHDGKKVLFINNQKNFMLKVISN